MNNATKGILLGLVFVTLGTLLYYSSIYPILLVPTGLFILLIGAIMFFNYIRKQKNKEKQVPEIVMEDLNYAERRWDESGGQIEPRAILLEIAGQRDRSLSRIRAEKPRVGAAGLPEQPSRRENLPSNNDRFVAEHKSRDTGVKRNNIKRLFGSRK